jgi:hypothetical protein
MKFGIEVGGPGSPLGGWKVWPVRLAPLESGQIPSIRTEKGLSLTCRARNKGYGSVSATHPEIRPAGDQNPERPPGEQTAGRHRFRGHPRETHKDFGRTSLLRPRLHQGRRVRKLPRLIASATRCPSVPARGWGRYGFTSGPTFP